MCFVKKKINVHMKHLEYIKFIILKRLIKLLINKKIN